ncbi:MAG: DUF4956 domain-containing protein [Acidobacteria bacterium]|nr:DUF4956 domain-containing protein [Acidobacteriota bacterium]
MPDFLTGPFADGPAAAPLLVLVRLLGALVFGSLVAFIYRRTRAPADVVPSFTTTLALLAVLIAMVTQVIGDNVARAFSLVGALSIVRFRTVVRDTQDTAYVIFAVAVGMAVGANNLWVAVAGIVVVALAAVLMRTPVAPVPAAEAALPFLLHVRLGLGHDVDALIGSTLDAHTGPRRLVSMATARQGMAIDVAYRAALKGDRPADDLVRALNRIEGVQSVTLERVDTGQGAVP